MKMLIVGMLLLSCVNTYASYRDLPVNFDQLSMYCSTWDEFDSDSMERSLEKFSISSLSDGIRVVRFNNSKESFACEESSTGLKCEGFAYQVNDDQYLEETTEEQKFKVVLSLDYSRHRGDLIEGVGVVPSGMFGFNKSRDLYCEILGDRKY
jgi:hypothetical protein